MADKTIHVHVIYERLLCADHDNGRFGKPCNGADHCLITGASDIQCPFAKRFRQEIAGDYKDVKCMKGPNGITLTLGKLKIEETYPYAEYGDIVLLLSIDGEAIR